MRQLNKEETAVININLITKYVWTLKSTRAQREFVVDAQIVEGQN